MKIPAYLRRRLFWLNAPSTILIALLQRTPVAKLMPAAGEMVIASPLGNVLRSAFVGVASVGIHTLAGATELSPSQPSPASATVGSSFTVAFTVTGVLSDPESWTIGGSTPPGLSFTGQNSGVLTLSGTPTTAGSYALTLKANNDDPAASTAAYPYTITVSAGGAATAPAITTQPQSQSVTVSGNVTFTAAASGSPAPTYQWRKEGVAISGATSATLALTNVQSGDAGTYTVVATNSAGSATSNGAVLTVSVALVAPAFTTQPLGGTVTAGSSVTLTSAASGNPAPTYQWRKDSIAISGATSATLALTNIQSSNAGTYTVVATNSVGTATSNGAVLTVSAAVVAPTFTTQPSNQTVSLGGTATFTVAASGSPAPTYQWRKSGTNISGAISATLALTNVQSGDAATYTVVATNSGGSATSNGAVLTVSAAALTITTQPFSQVVAPGSTLALAVVVSGQSPYTYQWSKDGSAIAGAAGASYSVASVTAATAGSYTVVITNAQGSVTSTAAIVGVGTPIPGRLANLSVRALAGADAQTLIVGFIIGGGSKPIVLRGLGPTLALAPFNVKGVLADPKLQIFGSTTGLPSNENWGDGNASASLGAVFNAIGAYPLDAASKDAGLLATLPSQVYTAWVTGATGTSGIALAEIFDTESPTSAGYLANISARAQVGTGDNVLIVGFIISGNVPKQILIRAVGPTLAGAPYNVPGGLADPRIDIYPAGASVPSVSNDNWADNGAGPALSAAFSATGAQALPDTSSKDAALLLTLPPGSYTAIVSGVNSTTGVALTELFQMP